MCIYIHVCTKVSVCVWRKRRKNECDLIYTEDLVSFCECFCVPHIVGNCVFTVQQPHLLGESIETSANETSPLHPALFHN